MSTPELLPSTAETLDMAPEEIPIETAEQYREDLIRRSGSKGNPKRMEIITDTSHVLYFARDGIWSAGVTLVDEDTGAARSFDIGITKDHHKSNERHAYAYNNNPDGNSVFGIRAVHPNIQALDKVLEPLGETRPQIRPEENPVA